MKMKKVFGATALVGLAFLTACNSKAEYESTDGMTLTGRVALVDGTDTAGTTWDPVTATSEVARVLNSTGDLTDVVLSNNDGMALGIVKDSTFKDAGIPIFGVDALADAIQGIKDGTMAGTIKNDSYTQAGVTLQLALNLVKGEEDILKDINDTNYKGIYTNADGKVEIEKDTKALRVHHIMVTKDNVNELQTPALVDGNNLGSTDAGATKMFALTYQNSDPNMSGLWKPGFNDYGKKLGVNIQWTDGAGDDKRALEAVSQAAAAGNDYQAFLINPVDQTNIKSYIKAIRDVKENENKPIIIWNREGDAETMKANENVYYVGIESAEGGRLQGQMAAEYIMNNGGLAKFDRNGDGRIGFIVVRGEKGHPDAEARTVASPQYLEKFLVELNK